MNKYLSSRRRSEEERSTALEKLQDHVWKGKKLRVKVEIKLTALRASLNFA